MTNGTHSVKLKGDDLTVTLPGFSEREDIATVYHDQDGHPRRQQRILYAALGLCLPKLGGGLDAYEAADLDPVKYGGRFYSSCMADGHKRAELITAAVSCFSLICESLFPREEEVSTAETFTGAQGAVPS
jgi:hypothetical protein